MSVPGAYLGVVLIWSTTPLAIKWSADGFGVLFSVTARMGLGLALCLALLAAMRRPLPWNRTALRAYLAAALGIFGAMLPTYWASRLVPSGLISVLFGMTPLVTGALAALVLGERSFTPLRLVGMGIGLLGLHHIFGGHEALGDGAAMGIGALMVGVFLHSLSAVLVKQAGAHLHPMSLNTGALLFAVALFAATWALLDGTVPTSDDPRSALAVGYLAVLGTAVGFNLYFYALKHLSAGAMSLITLVSPVLALVIGAQLNGEQTDNAVWAGTGVIIAGLVVYQWGDRLLAARRG